MKRFLFAVSGIIFMALFLPGILWQGKGKSFLKPVNRFIASSRSNPAVYPSPTWTPQAEILDFDAMQDATVASSSDGTAIQSSPIAKQIMALKAETLEQSLANLCQPMLFFITAYGHEEMGERSELPLHESVGRNDLKRICRNPRFLKVFLGLSKLPKNEASARINAQINTLLPVYQEIFQSKWDEIRKQKMVMFEIPSQPNGKPNIRGHRMAILSLVLIAGNLHLDQTSGTIAHVMNIAVKQRDQFYHGTNADTHLRQMALYETALYHRQILLTGLMGAQFKDSQIDAVLKQHLSSRESKVVKYVDSRTSGNASRRNGYTPLPTPSPKEITIRYISPVDDQKFDAIRTAIAH